ncbi:MAG: hypothetical protein AAF657_37645, partial [Acidobacteriota bacterium]
LSELRIDDWISWLRRTNETLEVIAGPNVRGDVEILVRPLPVDDSIRQLLDGLPVRLEGERLSLDRTSYSDPELALAVRLPHAEKRTWVVAGKDEERLIELGRLVMLKEAGARMWDRENKPFDYLLRETTWLERSGLWIEGETGVTLDRATERNDFESRRAYYAAMRTIAGRKIELRSTREVAERRDVREMVVDLEIAAFEMAQRIPLSLETPIRLVIEQDYVTQGRYLGNIGEAVLASDGAVHLVWHPKDGAAYRYQLARALLTRAGLAEGLPPWIERGAALWLSRKWFGHDASDWLPRLATAKVLPTAEQLLASERQADSSEPLWVPVAASLVDALPGKTLRQKLERLPTAAAVEAHLGALADSVRKASARQKVAASMRTKPSAIPFLKGISFAMFNRLDGGYHAPSVIERLERLRGLGSNAVSLMPFAYQPQADAPELRFMNRSPASETDIGTLHAARQAHAAGFHVLWKPHIWISGDSWPGDIAMRDDAAWTAWFETYRRYIVHHALLAEWAGSDLFSIGVELGQTLERRSEWEALIDSVRVVFSGAVTYSGNWFGDYDQAPFWDRLDFVGIDAYFPLADREDASAATVAAGARGVAERLRQAAERFDRPVLLTEVGYAARTGAWVEPHREGGEFSTDDQALAYRAFFDALGRPGWLRGVFVWKVFSASRGSSKRPDFRFLDRPAEAAVRDYFATPREGVLSSQPRR